MPHAMLCLFQSFALSYGMYGAQIWSTKHIARLLEDHVASTVMHMRHTPLLKSVLRVKRTVNNYISLRKGGHMPLHFYWLS